MQCERKNCNLLIDPLYPQRRISPYPVSDSAINVYHFHSLCQSMSVQWPYKTSQDFREGNSRTHEYQSWFSNDRRLSLLETYWTLLEIVHGSRRARIRSISSSESRSIGDGRTVIGNFGRSARRPIPISDAMVYLHSIGYDILRLLKLRHVSRY
jgi:hypothetical protein